MKNLLKILGMVIGLLLMAMLVVVIALPLLIDPNDYKDRIVALVKEQTGRKLEIRGDIGLTVFPSLALEMGAVELGNAQGFATPVFARVDELQARVKLLPLMSRRLEMDVVTVRGLVVNLARAQDGRSNWDDLLRPEVGRTGSTAAQPRLSASPAALAIGGLDIQDAAVSWDDQFSGQRYAVQRLTLKTTAIGASQPVELSLSFDLGNGQPGVEGHVTIQSRLRMDPVRSVYEAADLAFGADLEGQGLRGGSAEIHGRSAASFDATRQHLSLHDLRLETEGRAPEGYAASLILHGDVVGDIGTGSFESQAMKLEARLVDARGSAVGEFTAQGRVAADLAGQTIAVQGLQSRGRVAGNLLNGNRFDFDLSTELSGDLAAGSYRASGLKLDVDQSHLEGWVELKHLETPALAFNLAVDRLDLDRYLAAREATTEAAQKAGQPAVPATTPAPAAAGVAGLPLETLRKLDVEGQLQVASLAMSGLKLSSVLLGIQAKDGLIQITPVGGAVYGGDYAGRLALDARGEAPRISFDEKLARVRLDRLLRDLDVDTGDLDLRGRSDISLRGTLVGDPAARAFRLHGITLRGNLAGKSARLPMGLDGDFAVDLDEQTLVADKLRVSLGDMRLQGKLKLSDLAHRPRYWAMLTAPPFNPRRLLKQLGQKPVKTADPKALASAELAATLTGTSTGLSVESAKLRLDQTRLKGSLSLDNFAAPVIAFDVEVDSLNADRYLPPPEKGKTQAGGTPGAALASLPMDALRALNLDGKLAVGRLSIANLKLQDIQLTGKARNGRVTVHPLSANLYGGSYNGNVGIDARRQQPRLSLDERLTNIRAGPLLQDLQGKRPVTGRANVVMQLTAAGADADAITRSLGGNVSFSLADGTIEGADILGKLCGALGTASLGSLKREDIIGGVLRMVAPPPTASQAGDRTEFSELSGSMVIKNGVAYNDDLALKSPLLRVEGRGELNLVTQRLDYQATAALVKSCAGQGGKGFDELQGVPIPVHIAGPLGNPDVQANLTAGVLEILRQRESGRRRAQTPPPQTAKPAPSQPPPQDPNRQMEEAVRGIFEQGLRGLFGRP